MTFVVDENGRWELGFPKRSWPSKENRPDVSLPNSNKYGPRFVTDDEVNTIHKAYDGLFSIYRSVYKSRRYDFNENSTYGKPDKESAVVDKIFLEIECKPSCGSLCDGVMKDTTKLLNFLEDGGVVPRFNFSTNKSIHVFADFDEITIPFKHDTVKRVTRWLTKKSGVSFIDKNAQHGVTQLARLLNAQNPKTKRYAIPITRKEIMTLSADQIVNLAKEPRHVDIPRERNEVLGKMLVRASRDVAERKGQPEMAQADIDVEGCKEIEILIQKGASSGGRHYARVALIRWLMSKGKTRYEIETALKNFNNKCKPPDSFDSVMSDLAFNIGNDQKIPHCYFIFEATGMNCENCPWKVSRVR